MECMGRGCSGRLVHEMECKIGGCKLKRFGGNVKDIWMICSKCGRYHHICPWCGNAFVMLNRKAKNDKYRYPVYGKIDEKNISSSSLKGLYTHALEVCNEMPKSAKDIWKARQVYSSNWNMMI